MSDACEFPLRNASSDEIRTLLLGARVIAVVGISDKPDRDSYRVAAVMQGYGYRIVPVNPALKEVLREKAYSNLQSIPEKIDIVLVFRKPEAVPAIVEEALAAGARAIWMQSGIVHNQAAERAREQGLQVVMDRCIKVERQRLGA